MGHAYINTTMIYSHYAPAGDEADPLGAAFRASLLPSAAKNGASDGVQLSQSEGT
jgi:hypothetical protein